MLRATILRNDEVDINYPNLASFLKNSAAGCEIKKINIFQPEEIQRFLSEAEDYEYLAMKVGVMVSTDFLFKCFVSFSFL